MITLFLTFFFLFLSLSLGFGLHLLPRERWQVLATAPTRKMNGTTWEGTNFTWYGVFSANAYLLAVAVAWLLLRASGASPLWIASVALMVLAGCVPAASLVARLVEKKRHTFSVGAAVFVGTFLAPVAILLANRIWLEQVSMLAALAALSIAFAFGEGMGRLACISFGCCYGKPLKSCHPLLQRLFQRHYITCEGATRKAAYAGQLEGEKLFPIQALTAIILNLVGFLGVLLFLKGAVLASLLLATLGTQLWRAFSETLRADHRGSGRLSAYQKMALLIALAVSIGTPLLPTEVQPPDLGAALASFNSAGVLLFLQLLWLTIFVHTGRSSVTGSTMTFRVHEQRI